MLKNEAKILSLKSQDQDFEKSQPFQDFYSWLHYCQVGQPFNNENRILLFYTSERPSHEMLFQMLVAFYKKINMLQWRIQGGAIGAMAPPIAKSKKIKFKY